MKRRERRNEDFHNKKKLLMFLDSFPFQVRFRVPFPHPARSHNFRSRSICVQHQDEIFQQSLLSEAYSATHHVLFVNFSFLFEEFVEKIVQVRILSE